MQSRPRGLVLTPSLVIAIACLGVAEQRLARTSVRSVEGMSPEQSLAAAANPKDWLVIPLDQMKWIKQDDTDRVFAYPAGDRSKPGLYIQLVKWPPHTTAKAHSHPDERYGVVLSGTFYLGHGDKFDGNKLEKLSSGAFFSEPPGSAHFGATKDEGTVLYFVGMGPSRTDPIEK